MIATYSAVMLSDIVEINYHLLCRGWAKELNQGLDNGDGNGIAADGQLHVDEIDSSSINCPAVGMVKDIRSGSNSGSPDYLTAVGSTLYFRANDGTSGNELWKSDGTASGTVMVKDIYSGSSGGSPSTSQALVTLSISQPTTEPTETNCGRAMELPQAR